MLEVACVTHETRNLTTSALPSQNVDLRLPPEEARSSLENGGEIITEDQGCGSLCYVAMEQLGKQLPTVI